MSDTASPRRRILIWDLPTRLFHWLLVLGVLGSYLTAEVFTRADYRWHKLIGFTILGLLIFRLIWGFVGGRHSRFFSFIKGPRALFAYLRVFGRRDAPFHAGHNPLGALSVLALLASLLVQVASGLCIDDEILAAGPLAPVAGPELRALAGEVHEINFTILLVLMGLHVAAIAYYLLWQRHNLVTPMITGHAAAAAPADAGSSPSPLRFLLTVVIAVALVLVIVLGLPAWLPEVGGASWE